MNIEDYIPVTKVISCDDNKGNIDQQSNNPNMHNSNDNPEDDGDCIDYSGQSTDIDSNYHQNDNIKCVKKQRQKIGPDNRYSKIKERDV